LYYQEERLGLDMWSDWPQGGHGTVDIRMSADDMKKIQSLVSVPYDVIIPNIQTLVDAESMQMVKASAMSMDGDDFFKTYHTYGEIVEWMEGIATKHSDLVEMINIGETYEGREILGLRISGGNATRGIVYHGGQHAREWIGVVSRLTAWNLIWKLGQRSILFVLSFP
jgi:hypothetical protein